MITMILTTGPYINNPRSFTGYDDGFSISEDGHQVNVQELLLSCVQHGWQWRIYFSRANDLEVIGWGTVDLAARITRCLYVRQCPVYFEGIPYTDPLKIESILAGHMIKVWQDNETGLWITSHGVEPRDN